MSCQVEARSALGSEDGLGSEIATFGDIDVGTVVVIRPLSCSTTGHITQAFEPRTCR